MRIIGNNTKDYYDTAGWADHENIFMRRPYDGQEAVKNEIICPFAIPNYLDHVQDQNGDDGRIRYTFGLVLVAAEAYPFMSIRRIQNVRRGRVVIREDVISEEFVYDAAEAAEQIKRKPAKRIWRTDAPDVGVFMNMPRDIMTKWAIEGGVITAILKGARVHYDKPMNRVTGMVNCDGLDAHEFYKVIDPSALHMKLDGYISGVLGSNPDVVEISDVSKRNKAGFGDMSFKTRPGTKKPRSAKKRAG